MIRSKRPGRLCFILDIATEALCEDGGTDFNEWVESMSAFAQREGKDKPTAKELVWVWKALQSDSELNRAFGFLEPVPTWARVRAREEATEDIIEALPAGAVFGILLRPSMDLPEMQERCKKMHEIPIVSVRLDEPLCFRPGKAGRLECCPVKCTLTTPAYEATCEELAAMLFGVSEKDVSFHSDDKNLIDIPCTSLNHAYVMASKRFERNRRSHGGRIYNNLYVWHPSDLGSRLLDQIRIKAELGRSLLTKGQDPPTPGLLG